MAASDIIKKIRRKTGMSRRDLSKMLGMSDQYIIGQYERKNRYPNRLTWLKLIGLCEKYQIPIAIEDLKEPEEILGLS